MNMTPSQIIDAFGGTAKMAALCQVRSPSVSEWKHNGIPKARLMYLKLLRPDLFQAPAPAAKPAEAKPAASTAAAPNPFAL